MVSRDSKFDNFANSLFFLSIIIIIIYRFSHQRLLMVFHRSLSDSKSRLVSWTLLSVLAVLNNAVVWMVSTRPPTFKSYSPFNNPLVTIPKAALSFYSFETFSLQCLRSPQVFQLSFGRSQHHSSSNGLHSSSFFLDLVVLFIPSFVIFRFSLLALHIFLCQILSICLHYISSLLVLEFPILFHFLETVWCRPCTLGGWFFFLAVVED